MQSAPCNLKSEIQSTACSLRSPIQPAVCTPRSAVHSALCTLKSSFSVFLGCAVLVSACRHVSPEQKSAQAADEWTRSYPLDQSGRVSINNRNGDVQIEAVDGSTVEIRAERVTHATTDKTAKDLLPRIIITEDIKPELVDVRTKGIEGLLLGVSFEVTYYVKVPRWASVRVQTVNGDITVKGIGGRLVATTSSGDIKAERLSGGAETRAVNGQTAIDLAALGADPVSLRSTNGSIRLSLPASTAANLNASCVNGDVAVTGLTFEPIGEPGPERGRNRRLRGRLNKGGSTTIDIQTVNGSIAIAASEAPTPRD